MCVPMSLIEEDLKKDHLSYGVEDGQIKDPTLVRNPENLVVYEKRK